MPRDINGNYTLPAGNPVITGTTIASSWANSTLSDIATALTQSLSIDGSVTTVKIADDAVTPPKMNGLDVNGMVARISATEFEGRTITGTANQITVADGDGVSGDPTFTIPADFRAPGTVSPEVDSSQDIGTSALRWQFAFVEGINFPATQVPSAGANVLDDYEEGTWTPTLTFTTPGNLTVVYSTRVGNYVKIGKQVTVQFSIITSTFTHTTASGTLVVSGLPFAAADQYMGAVQMQAFTTAGADGYLTSRTETGLSFIDFVYSRNDGNGAANLNQANTPTGSTMVVIATITYNV